MYNNNGNGNTAIGHEALYNNGLNGDVNTAIGNHALYNNTTGQDNAALGHNAGNGITTARNVICIGAGVGGLNVNNSCYIGSIFGQGTAGGAAFSLIQLETWHGHLLQAV